MRNKFNFSTKDIKHYKHFDAPISRQEAECIVKCKNLVETNKFFPFLLYHEEWQPYRTADILKPEKKSRPIRYASRRDAYIFKYYRWILSQRYESRLSELGISHCPIAYRQIKKSSGRGGKCNIDFAKDAFYKVSSTGNCVTIALDIKSYFESLDHEIIKQIWCDLLDVERLPGDHFTVFKSITQYRYVNQQEVYKRLGYTETIKCGSQEIVHTVPYKEIPKQLCSSADFRAKICGYNSEFSTLVKKNSKSYGIPQGAPISDLIANFYLMEFDKLMNDYASERNGHYMRYSDDILIIVPGSESAANEAIQFAVDKIRNCGSQLQIKDKKTCIVSYRRLNSRLDCYHLEGPSGKNGLEYLGFRYDGHKVYIRESTMSRFYRKVANAAKLQSAIHVEKNPELTVDELIKSFNFSLFNQQFMKVSHNNRTNGYDNWTFYSYLKRAQNTFGTTDAKFTRQVRGYKQFVRNRVKHYITKFVDCP